MDNTLTSIIKQHILIENGLYLVGLIVVSLLITSAILHILAFLASRSKKITVKKLKIKNVTSSYQQKFFERLSSLLSPDFYIFPQIALNALVDTKGESACSKFNLKRFDFVVCNKKLSVVCAIELDEELENGEEKAVKEEKVAKGTGIKIIRYPLKNKITAEQIKEDILALC